MSTDPSNPTSPVDPGREAFDRIADARAAVDPDAIAGYGLDAVYAKGQAHLIARNVAPYLEDMAKLPYTDPNCVDRLVACADALQFVNSSLKSRSDRYRIMPELATEGFELRRVLMAYADLLVVKKTFQQAVIDRLREGSGYRDLAGDLDTLVQLYRAHPETTGPGAPVTTAEIDRAAELAHKMTLELAADAVADLSHADLIAERKKIAHLLLNAHDEIRRAVNYLRHHAGDAGQLVPSLYVPGGRGKAPAQPGDEHVHLAEIHDALHEEPADDPELNPFVDA